MPWSSNDGGGGGPWGQGGGQGSGQGGQGGGGNRNQNNWGGNRGGGGPGGLPPDLDDLIRRGKDSLKGTLPSGGRGTWLIPLALILAFVAYKSVYQVQADERGVVLRLGEYARTATPGLHFAIWPIETMEKPKVEAENQINFGDNQTEGLMLAGDQNIVDITFKVLWRISSPEDYLFNVEDQEGMVRAVAESAMREVVGRTPAEEIRTTGRQKAADEVRQITQATLDSYKAGIIITAVTLEKADPPQQVIAAFEEVQRAEQNQAQSINEADQYRNKELRQAEGAAAKILEDAKAYKARVVAEAQGEAQRFSSVYNEYKNAKGVTRERMFLETMEQVLGRANKVVIDSGKGGPGVVPYLPLPQIQQKQGASQ